MIQNPKRSTDLTLGKTCWYDYYAGYSHSFVKSVLDLTDLSPQSIILDPWNGTGTTTLASSLAGYKSIGADLNPVMVVIAKARLASHGETENAINNGLALTKRYKTKLIENDPLTQWITIKSVELIRKIELFILKGKSFNSLSEKVTALSNTQCIQYVALFNTVRGLLEAFIPTNPTWIKKAKDDSNKIEINWQKIKTLFIFNLQQICSEVKNSSTKACYSLKVASSTKLPLENCSVDLILSSPPYCTRIDYAVATLPELSILSVNGEKEIDVIRRALMGTTTVPKLVPDNLSFGSICDDFLSKVKNHDSRASSTYYYKNSFQYFNNLYLSIKEITRVLKPGGKCFLVVQDSYYKDIHCDLAAIIVDMFLLNGGLHVQSHEFRSKNNMANINTKSKKYRAKTKAIETVIELIKIR
ncbi:hypothetical protein [Proteus genomosp. 4]|uniref:hypothetical protein n=1 Tax=Proteus genomosp. 4 TaxID=1311818 RepID=UPI000D69900A|nr:hypothetical protein [Proteus genomosp. 4]